MICSSTNKEQGKKQDLEACIPLKNSTYLYKLNGMYFYKLAHFFNIK